MEVEKNLKNAVVNLLKIYSFKRLFSIVIALTSGLLYLYSLPPKGISGLAFIFAIPLLLWGLKTHHTKYYSIICISVGACNWLYTLKWLRYITWPGLIFLSIILGIIWGSWFIIAHLSLKKILQSPLFSKILGLAALSSFWMGLELLRAYIFTGFPWYPLSITQITSPLMLGTLPYIGSFGLSGIIIWINLILISYGWSTANRKSHERFRLCPEFYLTAIGFISIFYLFIHQKNIQSLETTTLTLAIVQPYTPPLLKWDPEKAQEQLIVLENLTKQASMHQPDAILWPEAATPLPIKGNFFIQEWAENLSKEINIPIWMGNTAYDIHTQSWENGCFIVTPNHGLNHEYYSKRHLVPFGEYIPLRKLWPWLKKYVPLEGDTKAGQSSKPLKTSINNHEISIGCLVCYEDIFSNLARDTMQYFPNFFLVTTNNAWYGEEGAAEQHFFHSILRAAETKRPFMRVGNAGQSGWIDEHGQIQEILLNTNHSPYFRGIGTIHFTYSPSRTLTPYVKIGDHYHVIISLISILILGYIIFHKQQLIRPKL